MATGEFADPIYKLIKECGGGDYAREVVLNDLIKYLSSDTLEDFIRYFRRNHNMDHTIEDDDTDTLDEEDNNNKFFSSLIPEC